VCEEISRECDEMITFSVMLSFISKCTPHTL